MQFCLEIKITVYLQSSYAFLPFALPPFRSCRPRIDFLSLCLMCQKSVFLNEWRSPNRLPPARVAKKKSKILSKILELCDMKYFIFFATIFAIFAKKIRKRNSFVSALHSPSSVCHVSVYPLVRTSTSNRISASILDQKVSCLPPPHHTVRKYLLETEYPFFRQLLGHYSLQ